MFPNIEDDHDQQSRLGVPDEVMTFGGNSQYFHYKVVVDPIYRIENKLPSKNYGYDRGEIWQQDQSSDQISKWKLKIHQQGNQKGNQGCAKNRADQIDKRR